MGVVTVSLIADAELEHQAKFASDQNPAAGHRVYFAAVETFQQLANTPEMGELLRSKNPRLHGLRFFGVSGFPAYLIFYRETADGIEVVRFLHAAQNWRIALGAD